MKSNWRIRVAIYKPKEGNFKHWALCADNGETFKIYEVTGEHGSFTRSVLEVDPEDSQRFLEYVDLTEIADRDHEDFERTIADTEVDNETVEWDCQDYVIEILDNLEEEFVIEGDDEEYQEQKKKLKDRRGPD